MADENELREMLTTTQVLDTIPFDRAGLFRLESEGLFPPGHFISPRKKLWFKDEVLKWQRDLADPNSELSKAVRLKMQRTKDE